MVKLCCPRAMVSKSGLEQYSVRHDCFFCISRQMLHFPSDVPGYMFDTMCDKSLLNSFTAKSLTQTPKVNWKDYTDEYDEGV
jgi:hypothetical protein